MTRTQKIFLIVVGLALLVCWSPSKTLPYAVPLVSVGLLLLSFRQAIAGRWLLLVLLVAVWFLLDMLLYPDFIIQNGMLAIVTYSCFFLPFIVPSRYLAGHNLYLKLCYVVMAVVLFEGAIGILQIGNQFTVAHSLDLSAGDVVEGTIDLALPSAPGFETPSYAAMMGFSILFLLPLYSQSGAKVRRIAAVALLVGAGTFLLSSVVHSLLFFLISVLVSGLATYVSLQRLKLAPLLLAIGGVSLAFLSAYILLPQNIRVQLPRNVQGLASNPKAILAERLVSSIRQYPQLLFTGLGPGQGVSRAALISTGEYLATSIQSLGLSPRYTDLISWQMMDLWLRYGRSGSTLRPMSSWLGALSEVGILGFLAGIAVFLYLFLRPAGTHPPGRAAEVYFFAFRAMLLYFFLLGFQEFYWEYPQAIFVGILFLMVLRAQTLGINLIREIRSGPQAAD